jgi:hypothetical protein
MEEATFQQITITPIRRTEDEPFRYALINGIDPLQLLRNDSRVSGVSR